MSNDSTSASPRASDGVNFEGLYGRESVNSLLRQKEGELRRLQASLTAAEATNAALADELAQLTTVEEQSGTRAAQIESLQEQIGTSYISVFSLFVDRAYSPPPFVLQENWRHDKLLALRCWGRKRRNCREHTRISPTCANGCGTTLSNIQRMLR